MEKLKLRHHDIPDGSKIQLITSPIKANQIIERILLNESAVIGVDIEAAIEMSRFGVICLLQLGYDEIAYIFDLVEMNYKEINFQKLFEQPNIIKVFHDCLEDLSLLSNLCHIKNIKGIFDTQIAHRMCYSFKDDSFLKPSNASISLSNLLKKYLAVEYELKGEIHELMANNPYLWKGRPLDKKLIHYAGKDVLYLPQIYDIIKANCFNKKYMNTTMTDILNECEKYLNYVSINLKIKNFNRTNLQPKTIIQGIIKNYQKTCVFIQLNIGYMGIVVDEKNINSLKKLFTLGDIILFQITELDTEKKRYVLEVSQMNINERKEQKEKTKANYSSIETRYDFPKLKVPVQTFIPKHLKNKIEKNQLNIIKEETKSDKTLSLFKDINNKKEY